MNHKCRLIFTVEPEKGEWILKRKAISGIMLTLLLISMLIVAFNVQQATASLAVRNIDTDLNYATILKIRDF